MSLKFDEDTQSVVIEVSFLHFESHFPSHACVYEMLILTYTCLFFPQFITSEIARHVCDIKGAEYLYHPITFEMVPPDVGSAVARPIETTHVLVNNVPAPIREVLLLWACQVLEIVLGI